MNNLEVYIRESIFNTSAEEKASTAISSYEKEMLVDLKLYTYDWLSDDDKKYSPWENGEVKFGKNGIEIDCGRHGYLKFYGGPGTYKRFPKFLISKVKGEVYISSLYHIESIDGIFTNNCMIDGVLTLYNNKHLKSLKGCPKSCVSFFCMHNQALHYDEIQNSPKNVLAKYRWYNNGSQDMVDYKVTKPFLKDLIVKHLNTHPSIIIRGYKD